MKPETVTSPTLRVRISREDVEGRNLAPVLATLTVMLQSSESVRLTCEKVDIEFAGYDEDPREIFEIVEVRNFVRRLDEKFPFWLFFLDKRGTGLQVITMCFMPASLPLAQRRVEYPKQLNALLSKRWFPALNHVCAYADFDESRIDELTSRAMNYLSLGPKQMIH